MRHLDPRDKKRVEMGANQGALSQLSQTRDIGHGTHRDSYHPNVQRPWHDANVWRPGVSYRAGGATTPAKGSEVSSDSFRVNPTVSVTGDTKNNLPPTENTEPATTTTMPMSTIKGSSPTPSKQSTSAAAWDDVHSEARSAWTIVGVIAVFLLLGLIIWFVWWMVAPGEPYYHPTPHERGPSNTDVGQLNSGDIHACGNVTVSGKLCVCKVASFRNGVIAPHIAAGCENAVQVHDPLVCKHALVRPVRHHVGLEVEEFISGVNNCTNDSGNQVTGWLPDSRRFAGSTTVTVNNKSKHAHVIVRTHHGDKIQDQYHAYNVGNSVQFESDGDGTWWVH